ncbi:MAG: DUF4364 family protein [Clostridia bacterium]|nr:DUF4364 family protein [Clostridia bacterium]
MLYNGKIEDELMIQFIILYTIWRADESPSYSDLLTVVQDNCDINFMDLQVGLDNLVKTGHASETQVSEMVKAYDITEKGKNIIEFVYKEIPLIIREPIDSSIKELYLEKRRENAVKAYIEPINENEYYSECVLKNDDRTEMLFLRLYAGERAEAERIAEYFKENSDKVYMDILKALKEDTDQ